MIYKQEASIRLRATHSRRSTYLGRVTIVLKDPLTRADRIKGWHRKRGLGTRKNQGFHVGRIILLHRLFSVIDGRCDVAIESSDIVVIVIGCC